MHDEDDAPVSVEVETSSGNKIDVNNVSGMKKAELIASGEMEIDRFLAPPNMPGKKLAELRANHRKSMLKSLNVIEGEDANPYKVGDLIKFKKHRSEITEIDGAFVMFRSAKNKKLKVHHKRVELIESEED